MEEDQISSEVLNERKQYIDSALSFLDAERKKVNGILERLGLTSEELLKTEKKQACPHECNHIMPEKALKKHIEKCKLLSSGYQKDELPSLLQDLDFYYENADSILKIDIDENLLNKIIWDHSIANGQVYTGHRKMPVSHIDENIMLTQEDRLALYQYVVRVSHEAGKVIPVDRNDDLLTTDWGSLVKKGLLDEQNNKQYSSKLEQLAALRDLKRRRQSYRAKNVHITKKSYTEIIREVISNQMEILLPEDSLKDSAKSEVTNAEHDENEESSSRRDDRDTERKRESPKRGPRDKWRTRDVERKRERSRDRDRSRENNRSRNYFTSREKDKSRERDRSWDRFRERDRSRDSRRSRDRSRQRDKYSEDKRHRVKNEVEGTVTQGSDSPCTSSGWAEDKSSIVVDDHVTYDTMDVNLDVNLMREIKTETIDVDEASAPNWSSANVSDKQFKQSSSESDSDRSHRRKSKHKKHKHKKKHSKSKKHRSKD